MINNENITSKRVSAKKVNYYMTLLRNSKELTESYVGEESFKIVSMYFKKNSSLSNIVDFYGNIESDSELRYITGRIIDLNSHQVYIKDATIVRNGVSLEENAIYSFGETLCRLESDEILRITRYDDTTYVLKRISREDFYTPVIEEKRVLVRGK